MRHLFLFLLLAGSVLAAGGSLPSGSPKYQWQTVVSGQQVNPGETVTPSAIFAGYPSAGGARVLQVATTSVTPSSVNLSILVVGSIDGTTFEDVTYSTSVTRLTADGTFLLGVGAPRCNVPWSKVVLINHSASVTVTSATVQMGCN